MQEPAPTVTTQILHPDVFLTSGLRLGALRNAILRNLEWIDKIRPLLHHATPEHLQADVQILTEHAQALLDKYGAVTTRDLDLLVIPSVEHDYMTRWHGLFAQWVPGPDRVDAIHFQWSRTDLDPAIRVLTHEVGHHLRSFEADTSLYESMKLTSRLLQEATAERLVLAEHGRDALHHDGPCSALIHSHLHALLIKERDGAEFSAYEEDLRAMLIDSEDLYPAASSFMLRLGLTPAQLFAIPIRKFLDLVLPLCDDLP